MSAIFRVLQFACMIVVIGCGLWLFLVPYDVWGWIGGLAAVLLPGVSHIVALIVGGSSTDWMLFGVGTLAGIIAAISSTLAEKFETST